MPIMNEEQRLQGENAWLRSELTRIKAERNLAVRVAIACMDEFVYHTSDNETEHAADDTVWTNEAITYGDIRTVKAWDKALEKA